MNCANGDHAEFTLLERKHRSHKLDKAVVFSTLEPCAPGARKHPKLSCAERIVLARIKEVRVGIEDPDPTVDRKDIKYLQDNGVKVHLFDRDLQERIREVNREFIVQAEERAAAVRSGSAKPATLSEFEGAQRGAALTDLDAKALEEYRKVLGAKSALATSGSCARRAKAAPGDTKWWCPERCWRQFGNESGHLCRTP